jgi:hypothetical protein
MTADFVSRDVNFPLNPKHCLFECQVNGILQVSATAWGIPAPASRTTKPSKTKEISQDICKI